LSPQIQYRHCEELPAHVARNRTYWDSQADDYVCAAERHWDQADPTWGIWGVPESELHLLPERLEGATSSSSVRHSLR
jgi:hypothetical protein